MSGAKKLLSDRMADNRAMNPSPPAPDESYQFAGYSSGGEAFVQTAAGEVLPASIATNGYIKPGQPIDVTDTGRLSIEAMPKVRSRTTTTPAVLKLKYKVKILYFINNAQTGKTEVWVGGDRFQPKKITEFPLNSDIKGLIHNLGKDDKYVISLRIGTTIRTYHDKESFSHALNEEDKLKRARLNPVGHGYFAEFRDPYLLPVTVPNSAIGDFMFASFDALFPEVCSGPNICTSSSNDNQAAGTGARSESQSTKNYSLKPWAFYKGETMPMPPDAIRSQAGTYGTKANDIIETNSLTQSVLLSPNITRSVTATDDRGRIERSNGSATGSQSWYFTLKLSHPDVPGPDKYYEFTQCSDGAPSVVMTRSPFQTNVDPKFNTTILSLTVAGKKVFAHTGEFVYRVPNTQEYSLSPYVYELSTPIEVDGTCEVPEDLPEDGPNGSGPLTRIYVQFTVNLDYQSSDFYGYRDGGSPKPSSPTPPDRPPGEPYFEAYFNKTSLHWRTAIMGDQKQVIAKRSEYAISNGPSPNPVTAINKEEYILITQSGQEIILGGTLPITIGPKDNLMGVKDRPSQNIYYWINDDPYFSQNPQPKSSIRQLDLTEYNLGISTTKKTSKETIYPIPDNAIVQNCSYHPD